MRYTGRWRIYYGDGSTYSDRDGSPFGAPGGGVQVICNERDNDTAPPTVATKDQDCYRWQNVRWVGCTRADLEQYYLKYAGPQKVILGWEMDHKQDHHHIVERALREGVG